MIFIDDVWPATISEAIEQAIELAKREEDEVCFFFNTNMIVVDATCDAEESTKVWANEIYLSPTVIKCFRPRSGDQWEEIKEAVVAVQNKHEALRESAYQKKCREARSFLKGALLASPPTAEIMDKEKWDTFVNANTDPYGTGVVMFAERWARLMDGKIQQGEKLEYIADECCSVADTDGITGFMYGCAVQTLAQTWRHGEALRRWHNKSTQFGTEGDEANETGGVLNPAILCVGGRSND